MITTLHSLFPTIVPAMQEVTVGMAVAIYGGYAVVMWMGMTWVVIRLDDLRRSL